jgi:predicted nucleic acid-binding protein
MIFLDSDILSYFFNGNKAVYEKIKECIESNIKLATTCINYYEILKGLKYRSAEESAHFE